MKIIVPPIKSQGIKTKLVPWIHSLLPEIKGKWVEPFLGTGVVAFNCGLEKAILNDTNPHIINFYQSLQEKTITAKTVQDYLEKEGYLLKHAGNNGYDHFRVIRDRFNKNFNSLDFLFLSRAGFNGMMRFNKKGEWNIPFCQKPNRFCQSYITKIVNQVRTASQIIRPGWEFYNKSFEEIIPFADSEDIIYCDPPYIGRYVDYYNGWSEKDEFLLMELLLKTKARFILSTWHHNDYRKNDMIAYYSRNFNLVTRDHFYHSGGKIENRRSIVEALVFNFDSDIQKHNHDVVLKPEQLKLFDKGRKYIIDNPEKTDYLP